MDLIMSYLKVRGPRRNEDEGVVPSRRRRGGVNCFVVAEVRRPPRRVNSIMRQVDPEPLRSSALVPTPLTLAGSPCSQLYPI